MQGEEEDEADPPDLDEVIPRRRLDAASAREVLHQPFEEVHESDE